MIDLLDSPPSSQPTAAEHADASHVSKERASTRLHHAHSHAPECSMQAGLSPSPQQPGGHGSAPQAERQPPSSSSAPLRQHLQQAVAGKAAGAMGSSTLSAAERAARRHKLAQVRAQRQGLRMRAV